MPREGTIYILVQEILGRLENKDLLFPTSSNPEVGGFCSNPEVEAYLLALRTKRHPAVFQFYTCKYQFKKKSILLSDTLGLMSSNPL